MVSSSLSPGSRLPIPISGLPIPVSIFHSPPMLHHISRKQPNSRMCLVCGLKNPFGLKSSYFELDNGDLVCVFRPEEHHQSYPGRVHGGITAAVLDETIGRAIMIKYGEGVWGVTVDFSVRYRKPVPIGAELRAVGRITR